MREESVKELRAKIEELQNTVDVLQERLQIEDTRLIKNSVKVVISRVVHAIKDHSVVGYIEECREEFVMDLDSPEDITYGFSNGFSNNSPEIHQFHDVCIMIPGLYKSIDKSEVKGILIKFPSVPTYGYLINPVQELFEKLRQIIVTLARLKTDKSVTSIVISSYPDEDKVVIGFDMKTEPYSTGVAFHGTPIGITVLDKTQD